MLLGLVERDELRRVREKVAWLVLRDLLPLTCCLCSFWRDSNLEVEDSPRSTDLDTSVRPRFSKVGVGGVSGDGSAFLLLVAVFELGFGGVVNSASCSSSVRLAGGGGDVISEELSMLTTGESANSSSSIITGGTLSWRERAPI